MCVPTQAAACATAAHVLPTNPLVRGGALRKWQVCTLHLLAQLVCTAAVAAGAAAELRGVVGRQMPGCAMVVAVMSDDMLGFLT
jgi:hypothetical protein